MRIMLRAATLTVVLAMAGVGSVAAHEKDFPAKTLIEQAIALLRTQPEQRGAIEDKMHDAQKSEGAKGVDLELVRQADEAFEAGRLHETRDLLEEAIGAAPHRVVEEPNPAPGIPAPEQDPAHEAVTEAAPVLHEGALDRGLETPQATQEWVLLGIALVLIAAGLFVARRAT